MLRNHGLLTVGRTVADAFLNMYVFEIDLPDPDRGAGGRRVISVNPKIVEGVAQAMKVQTGGMGGAFVWPALLRKLDRTDASYKH